MRSNRRSTHEASHPWFAWRQSQHSEHLGGRFPGPRRSGLLPLASRATVLRSAALHSRTKRTSRPFPQRSPLLHSQSAVETPLVLAGLWLRSRSPRRDEVDEKALLGLRGIVRISRTTLNGR